MTSKLSPRTWLLLACFLGLSGCCRSSYTVRTNAHTLERIAPFTLPNANGKKIAVGKPWQRATAIVMIRGHW